VFLFSLAPDSLKPASLSHGHPRRWNRTLLMRAISWKKTLVPCPHPDMTLQKPGVAKAAWLSWRLSILADENHLVRCLKFANTEMAMPKPATRIKSAEMLVRLWLEE
jgi:hypothetical protein